MLCNVVQVVDEVAGSELVGDAAMGASSITVSDTVDYSPDGGFVSFTDGTETNLEYLSSDDASGIVTLAAPLAAAHLDGDQLQIEPLTVERVAHVAAEDQDEALEALVPHSLYDRMPTGIRDDDNGESELVDVGPNEQGSLVVLDVVDREPSIDGSFIDTSTLPPAGTDGSPPSTSPAATVIGGIGTLFVSWPVIANSDPIEYEVHISTTSGFTPGPTTLYTVTGATQAVIRTLPDLSLLDYATTYYVRLVATDADGAAAAGAEGSGSPAQVTGPDIAVQAITADNILANTLTADQISAVLEIAGTFETASEGQRVVIDPSGLHLYDSDGNELVAVPTDDSKSPTFRGDVVTGGLTVLDRMLIQGASNEMDKGAQLALNAQLASPGSAPSLAFEYETGGFTVPHLVGQSQPSAWRGLDRSATGGTGGTSTCYYTVGDWEGTWTLFELDGSTFGVLRSQALRSDTNVDYLGVVQLGAYVWTLWQNTGSGAVHLDAYNLATLGFASSVTLSIGTIINRGLALGTDGTRLLVASWSSISSIARPTIDAYTVSGSTATISSSANMSGTGGAVYGTGQRWITALNARQGSQICLVTEDRSGTNRVTSFELYNLGTLAKLTTDGHTWCPDAVTSAGNSTIQPGGGVTYDGTQYQSIRRIASTIINYSGWVWTAGTSSDTWWVGYQWYDSGGPSHTKLSPLASVQLNGASASIGRGVSGQIAMRGQLRVISPSFPSDADDTQTYMLPASSAPALTSMKLQSPFGHTLGAGSYTQYLNSYASGGAAYVDTNTFPGGGTSKIISSGGVTAGWSLGGDDTIVLPRSTVAQRPGSPTKADLRFNEDRGQVEVYDGAEWATAGPEVVVANFSIASTAQGGGGTMNVTIPGLNVGDLCFWAGINAGTGAFTLSTRPLCATANTIVLNFHNTDTGGGNKTLGAADHYFLVIRRS